MSAYVNTVLTQKLPVTAVAFYGSYLFAAQGGLIRVFNTLLDDKKAINSIPCFKQSAIYGFYILQFHEEKFLLAFGGKCICLFKFMLGENKDGLLDCEASHSFQLNDWIMDVVNIYYKSSATICLAVALAHNSVVLYDCCKDEVVKEVHCAEKCILYSAHFVRDNRVELSWESLMLCAGTVFNQIYVWKPYSMEDKCTNYVLPLCGHDGVIFNISYNPDTKLFLSASDDRSIRVWNSQCISSAGKDSFLSNVCSSDSACLCCMYGHEARVWKVASFVQNGEKHIVSAAEDGYCIIWKLFCDEGKMSASIVKKMNFHSNLLSLALSGTGEIAVGGIDGSIRLMHFSSILQPAEVREAATPEKEIFGVLKSVKLLTKNGLSVLAHTDKGSLLRYCMKTNAWTVVQRDDKYGSYAIMSVNADENLVGLGNTQGCVKILLLGKDHQVASSTDLSAFQGKVLSVTWFGNNLYLSGPNGAFMWYKVHGFNEEKLHVSKFSTFTLPQAKHRWHTDAYVISSDPHVIVCGDRRGSVHTFVKGSFEPLSSFHGVHGKLGVTSLTTNEDVVISTGRDGHWRAWSFEHGNFRFLAKYRSAQGMDWIEGCDIINYNGERRMYVHGFHGNKFVVWSKFSGDELFSVLCGGGHRSWDFSIGRSLFTFLKAGRLNIVQTLSSIAEESFIVTPLHSQHINCVRHLTTYNHTDCTIHVIATAGEDTKVIISAVILPKKVTLAKVQSVCVIDDHLSNVRCIDSVAKVDNSFATETLIFTGGGRASLNVYLIKISKTSPLPKVVVNHAASYSSGVQEASEMRFMSITAWTIRESDHRVAIACSDGKMRIFQVKNNRTEIKVLYESKEYDHCFLTVSRMGDFLVYGSTSGVVYFTTSSLEEVASYKCHQSGINSVAHINFSRKANTYSLLATGGDDNAIHLKLFENESDRINPVISFHVINAHSTQITGLHLKSVESNIILTSVSIDQRLLSWRIEIDNDFTIVCNQVASCLTHVADVSSMDVNSEIHFVCGQGLELITSSAILNPI